jgi:drug/metabolite transporter (DMT)-like permease
MTLIYTEGQDRESSTLPIRPIRVNGLDLSLLGETAAVSTSCLWTISSVLFTSAGKKIGPLSLNAYRTLVAVGFLVIVHAILFRAILPMASDAQWFWMGASGVVGLGIGDSTLFAAYVTIGPRRSLLVYASAPIFASIGAYLVLGETVPTLAILGIALTLAGIAIVLVEREHSGETRLSKRLETYGVFFALIGAVGQGVGLVLAKKGIDLYPEMSLNPLSATLMRMILGAISLWAVLLAVGKLPELRKAIYDSKGMTQTVAAAFLGPFLGVTLSMVAVTYAEAGIAQTLMSLMPVLIIPVMWLLYRQRTSRWGVLGAIIAVIGVSILFIV